MSSKYAFTKLFSNITASSVWGEPYPTRLVWITMLAEADPQGNVNAAVPGLARLANVSLDECEIALRAFLSPDRYSRTKEHDGRRIVEIPGGWHLLNYEKYRSMRDEELRREYRRNWMAEHRAQESKPEAPEPAKTAAAAKVVGLPEWLPLDVWNAYCAHRKAKRASMTEKSAEIQIKNLAKWREQGHDPRAIIERTIGNGWTGLFPPDQGPKNRADVETTNRAAADNWAASQTQGDHRD